MLEEENDVLPRFAACEGVGLSTLVALGGRFDLAKLTAPTRCVRWCSCVCALSPPADSLPPPPSWFIWGGLLLACAATVITPQTR